MDTERKLRLGVFDFESNGFLDAVTNIWCMWAQDPISNKSHGWRPDGISDAVKFLETFDIIIGHNIIEYDIPLIRMFYPTFKCPKVFDTLVLSRMLEPDRYMHSLKSYGVQFKNLKGDYGEEEQAWNAFSEEMFIYCEQDVSLNVEVYNYLCERAGFDPSNPPGMAYKEQGGQGCVRSIL